ncbi:MAG: hypothetical protein ACOC8F_07800 [Planctomycetota bacterium]
MITLRDMTTLRKVLCVCPAVVLGLACAADAAEPHTRPVRTRAGITLSRETTYVTGPLNDDGTVNYVAYLNRKYSKGVTPDNNAAVVLLEALGPEMIAEEIRAETYKRLGMDPPPVKGDYFVDLDEYVEALPAERKPQGVPGAEAAEKKRQALWQRIEAGGPDAAEAFEELEQLPEPPETAADIVEKRRQQTMEGPWTAEQYPILADWLAANAGALDRIVTASKLPRFYKPKVSTTEPPTIVNTLLPSYGTLRNAARALTNRAMLRWAEGDRRGAWADLMAVRRLGRRLGQDSTLIGNLVGLALEALGNDAMQRLVIGGAIPAADVEYMLSQVKTLKPLPDIRQGVANERFLMLDTVMMLARGGTVSDMIAMSAAGGSDLASPSGGPRMKLDYDLMLRRFNEMWDWYLNCERIEDPQERAEALERFDEWLIQTKLQFPGEPLPTAGAIIGSVLSVKRRTEVVADLLISILMPSLDRAQVLWRRANADGAVTLGATALAAYRAEQDAWPAELAALTPEYLEAVPRDPFTDEPLVYKRTDDGYVLYSLGSNRKDDGGVDEYDTGDIALRVPPADEDE